MDDIIVWASSVAELSLRISEITFRCEKANIILSKKKFVIGEEMSFAGYMISKNGVKPDAGHVKAIKEFPVPTDATGVESFLGLTNQLSFFIPDHIQNSKAMRELERRSSSTGSLNTSLNSKLSRPFSVPIF